MLTNYDKQERMKGRELSPPYAPQSKGNTSQGIFRHGTQFFRGCYHARCVDVFVEDENACKAAWAVHVSKILVTRLAISIPPWDFRNWEWSK